MDTDNLPSPGNEQSGVPPASPSVPPGAPAGLSPDQLTDLAVANAKRIIQSYATDPITLSQQLNQLRTAYLRDRYDMVVKVAEQNG